MNTPQNPHTHIADTIIPRINPLQKQDIHIDSFRRYKKPKGKENTPSLEQLVTHPVIVYWIDAQSGHIDWTPNDTPPDTPPEPTISIGWLTHTHPTHIILTTIINTTHHAHTLTIPTGCITHITPLT